MGLGVRSQGEGAGISPWWWEWMEHPLPGHPGVTLLSLAWLVHGR